MPSMRMSVSTSIERMWHAACGTTASGVWHVAGKMANGILCAGFRLHLHIACCCCRCSIVVVVAVVAFVISINGLRASSCCRLKKGTIEERKEGEWGGKATAKGLQKSIYWFYLAFLTYLTNRRSETKDKRPKTKHDIPTRCECMCVCGSAWVMTLHATRVAKRICPQLRADRRAKANEGATKGSQPGNSQ